MFNSVELGRIWFSGGPLSGNQCLTKLNQVRMFRSCPLQSGNRLRSNKWSGFPFLLIVFKKNKTIAMHHKRSKKTLQHSKYYKIRSTQRPPPQLPEGLDAKDLGLLVDQVATLPAREQTCYCWLIKNTNAEWSCCGSILQMENGTFSTLVS